ncbi:MAG: ABC transporter substrate-binding protein [Treponema sp.]|nr:ABC transporter substrate-binding protein [Treponema sp.]
MNFFSCSNDVSDSADSSGSVRGITVAVVMHGGKNSEEMEHFKQIADWYGENFMQAQRNSSFKQSFELKLEWYDEDAMTTEELAALAGELVERKDIFAIIGPTYSSNVEIFAEKCFDSKKPLIAPTASSENLVRSYAVNVAQYGRKKPFLWTLTQTDEAQIEALVAQILSYGAKRISLLSSADSYGRTFFEWTPFIASEANLELVQNLRYTSENTGTPYTAGTVAEPLETALEKLFSQETDYIICALSSTKDIETVLKARNDLPNGSMAGLLFSDTAFSKELLQYGLLAEGVSGTAPVADPKSGFFNAYKARFGGLPLVGEAHFYDALLLCGFAAASCIQKENTDKNAFSNENINNCLIGFNGSADDGINAWTAYGMSQVLSKIQSGISVNINGATGALDFDSEEYTSALETVYAQWIVIDGNFLTLQYISDSDCGIGTVDSTRSWLWDIDIDEMLLEESKAANITYESRKSSWAVIIAASTGWSNYRHQADALYLYQFLKSNGFSDDNIVLIIADDIASYKRNKRPGEIFCRINGENLYTDDVEIDYLLSELNPERVSEILCGQSVDVDRSAVTNPRLAKTPTVLNTDEHANILWFWSGHGANRNGSSTLGQFVWADGKQSGFTTELMEETLKKMKAENRFRKLLIVTETCYSASVLHVAEGIDGVLAFTAANGQETSLADIFSVELGVWLSNRFTHIFFDSIMENLNCSFWDLYNYSASKTIGSHVCLFNADNYESLAFADAKEFVTPYVSYDDL